nr:TIGR01777 family protein [Desulfobacula sp.]
MKKIVITGASGFIGGKLARFFLAKGYPVTGLGTSKAHALSQEFPEFEWVSADTSLEGHWQRHIKTADLVINLAGRSIFRYWTKKTKQAIYDSRVLTTRNLVTAMEPGSGQTLLTTSAVGIYGDRGEDELTEESAPGESFLARVCVDWEKEGLKAKEKGVRVAVMRFGVVLGDKGALSLMTPAFRMFAGGPLGSGNHWFPWIHIDDLIGAAGFILENEALEGRFNFTGKGLVRQKDFAKALGRVLKRPAFIPAPAFLVRAGMGELGSALLESQKAIPRHLLDAGYAFKFTDVGSALEDVFNK